MPEDPPTADSADVATIDSIVRALYDSVSFAPGQPPDWNRLRSLCAPGAHLIKGFDRATGERTVDQFAAEAAARIAAGELPSFHEHEIARATVTFGCIAHVFSTYEARLQLDAPEPHTRGINSIQLWRHDGRWWVVGVLWDEERDDLPIPDSYLPLD